MKNFKKGTIAGLGLVSALSLWYTESFPKTQELEDLTIPVNINQNILIRSKVLPYLSQEEYEDKFEQKFGDKSHEEIKNDPEFLFYLNFEKEKYDFPEPSSELQLILMSAPNCIPCRPAKKTLENLDYPNTFYCDASKMPATRKLFGIKAYPSLIAKKDSQFAVLVGSNPSPKGINKLSVRYSRKILK